MGSLMIKAIMILDTMKIRNLFWLYIINFEWIICFYQLKYITRNKEVTEGSLVQRAIASMADASKIMWPCCWQQDHVTHLQILYFKLQICNLKYITRNKEIIKELFKIWKNVENICKKRNFTSINGGESA
jgi:hypothetical protein